MTGDGYEVGNSVEDVIPDEELVLVSLSDQPPLIKTIMVAHPRQKNANILKWGSYSNQFCLFRTAR